MPFIIYCLTTIHIVMGYLRKIAIVKRYDESRLDIEIKFDDCKRSMCVRCMEIFQKQRLTFGVTPIVQQVYLLFEAHFLNAFGNNVKHEKRKKNSNYRPFLTFARFTLTLLH